MNQKSKSKIGWIQFIFGLFSILFIWGLISDILEGEIEYSAFENAMQILASCYLIFTFILSIFCYNRKALLVISTLSVLPAAVFYWLGMYGLVLELVTKEFQIDWPACFYGTVFLLFYSWCFYSLGRKVTKNGST
ncbi:MAG: hypothetical protein JXA82_12030 [Sedimentisphaerales bacterium]|nr:hypothetical protein [Sedimentisphaerales bacterium]